MDVSSFGLLFLLLVSIVVVFTYYNKEGFENPTLRIPDHPVAQKNLVEPSEQDYSPMSYTSTGPAPGSLASFNSLPYQDPTLEKANYQRLLNVQTTLKGFLENEAPNIQDLSDPSIQLPLSSARADLNKLNNEVLVLKRNPGIQSSLTQGDLDEIQANLAYLQRKWRMSVYNDLNSVEGFEDASGTTLTDTITYDTLLNDTNNSLSNTITNSLSNTINNTLSNTGSTSNLLTTVINTIFSGSNTSNVPTTSNNVSLNDLRTLITKIDVTIARLTSSGTTDPVVLARISVLNKIKDRINSIINDVIAGVRDEKDIPITKDAMDNFLKVISNTNSPLAPLFGSNVALADLIPSYANGDVNGAMFAQYLFKQYADTLFKGLSWSVGVNLNYTSENEKNMANSLANAIGASIRNVNTNTQPYNNVTLQDLAPYNNSFSNVINNLQQQHFSNAPVTQQQQTQQQQTQQQQQQQQQQIASRGQPFDWHERANFICQSIEKRELNPKDFGCLRPEDYVSENFSWRGYAKMICGRLGTSYDTSLPEVCGCPPTNWSGWTS